MYHESIIFGRCRVQLTCEHGNCWMMITVFGDGHDDARRQLLAQGWSLHRGKQLCPTHSREALQRNNSKVVKAWGI